MARKNKNKKPTASKKQSGVTIIRNVPVDDNGVPVQIKTHKDSKGGHPHIIVDSIDDCHVSVGVTHDNKKGKNATNYAMDKNILGGKKRSYMHRQGTVDKKQMYYGDRVGVVSQCDYNKAKGYGEKAKQKYIDKKNKKK